VPFIAYTIRIVEWFSSFPHGSIPLGKIGLPLILLFYLVLVIVTFNRSRLPSLVNHLAPSIPLAFLAILTIITWRAAFYAPDGFLHATILNVGTGDAVLI